MKKLAFLLVAAAVAVSPVIAAAKEKKSKQTAEAEDIAKQHDNTWRAVKDSLPLWLPTWSLPVYFNVNKDDHDKNEKKKKHKAATASELTRACNRVRLVFTNKLGLSASVRFDVRVLDDAAPDFGFLLDEGCGFGRRAAGGAQVDLCKVVLRLRAVQHFVDGLVEFGDDCCWRLRRRGQRVPGAGLEALYAGFVERRDIRAG